MVKIMYFHLIQVKPLVRKPSVQTHFVNFSRPRDDQTKLDFGGVGGGMVV